MRFLVSLVCLCVCVSLHTSRYQSGEEMIRFSRSRGQMPRSCSDKYRHLVNSIDPEPLKGFEPKLTQIYVTLGERRDYVFKVMESKVKVTQVNFGFRNLRGQRTLFIFAH